MKKNLRTILLVVIYFCSINLSVFAQDTTKVDLYDMDLSALMEMTVTTASKKAQSIDEAPAAVTVITKEDLMFYGADNLGEALRLVPGMEIIQGSDANYEISVRGFSRTGYNTSNKVLWLVDGRSAYYDGLGGFRMESCPIAIDDIERIEVIRGSGSALYGANAYSGIVNIITKKATEDGTHGAVSVRYGNLNQVNTSANIIGKSNKLSYKATVGYNNINQKNNRFDGLDSATIKYMKDYGYIEGTKTLSNMKYGNMAVQYDLKENQSIRVAGGISNSNADHYYLIPGEVKALDFFGQIDYNDEKNSFRAFYNSNPKYDYQTNKFMYEHDASNPYLAAMGRLEIDTFPGESQILTRTMDFEYQRNITFSDKLSAIAGASYRGNFIEAGTFATDGTMPLKKQNIFAGFTQIDYKPVDGLNISLGGRVDNHTTVGTNFNPKVAAVYKASDKHILRAGWGTATRNPNAFDNYLDVYYQAKRFEDLGIPFSPIYNLGYSTPNIIFNVKGSTSIKPEQISSFELGYIFNASDKLQLKVDAFYNSTKNSIEFGNSVVTDAFIGSLSSLENIYGINAAFGSDLSALSPYNGNVDPTIPNTMTKAEMEAQITELTNLGNGLILAGQTATGQQLLALADGLTQVSVIYNYNLPRKMDLPVINSDKIYQSFGAEVGFTYIPVKGLTVSGNYSLLKFSDNYNQYTYVYADTNGITSSDESLARVITTQKSSMHKANLGVKYKIKNFYVGVAFSYMSGLTQAADNNRNGSYDTDDIDNPKYDNDGLFTIDSRMNLNLNIGFQTKNLEIFVSGFNLIQPDYQQFYYTTTIAGSDLLNRRLIGGIKVKF